MSLLQSHEGLMSIRGQSSSLPNSGMRRMMTSPAGSFRAVDPRQFGYFLIFVTVSLLTASVFAQDPLAYLLVTIPVLVAPFMWVNAGAYGIPVMPLMSALYYVYYALPVLVGDTVEGFRPSELFQGGLSVGLFLLAASLATWPFLGVVRNRAAPSVRGRVSRYAQSIKTKSITNLAADDALYRLIFIGFAGGIIYNLAFISGVINVLGTYVGVLRAGAITISCIACYMMGFARGAGSLTGQRWVFAFAGFIALTVLSISNLLLVGGALNIVATVLGYVLSSKRIPWLGIGVAFAIVSILNAGKSEIRTAYWGNSGIVQISSISHVPSLLAEWFVAGLSSSSSSGEAGSKLLN